MSTIKRSETQISTHGTRLRAEIDLRSEKGFGVPRYQAPPEEVQEEQYQAKLMAGFKLYQGKGTKRVKVMCKVCFQVYTSSGSCNCN
jgi:hypothetical protein